jgi:hypothetical protein
MTTETKKPHWTTDFTEKSIIAGLFGLGESLASVGYFALNKLAEQGGVDLSAISQKAPFLAEIIRNIPHYPELLPLVYIGGGLSLIALGTIVVLPSSQNKNKSNA